MTDRSIVAMPSAHNGCDASSILAGPTKACTMCSVVRPITDFARAPKRGRLHYSARCKPCMRRYMNDWYRRDPERRRQIRSDAAEFRAATIEWLTAHLCANPCVDCGEKDLRTLDFDHRDDATKVAAVSTMLHHKWSLVKVKAEVAKCEVRCANCHRKRTANMRNDWRSRHMRTLGTEERTPDS